MKNTIIVLTLLVLIAGGAYFYMQSQKTDAPVVTTNTITPPPPPPVTVIENTPTTTIDEVNEKETVIGTSVEEKDITAYHYGTGDTELLFVGGIHGGYEWNTVLVAYELMDYLEKNPQAIPENVRVTVIPVLNPDGLMKVAGTAGKFAPSDISKSQDVVVSGRFNANKVDLNRNFDCDWKTTGTWQTQTVSGGKAVFSEPESQAFRDYVADNRPDAVIAWYSSAGGVFTSSCHNDVSPETLALTNTYATASGYKAYADFDFYEITGDMVNWLAKNDIPAISVLLTNHTDTEWTKNVKGIEAVFKKYAQ